MFFSETELDKFLLIGTGGFFGAICRFGFCEFLQAPINTLSVNVLGSFLLGLIMYDKEYVNYLSPRSRIAFGTGFMGALTTFSTFALQSLSMPFFMPLETLL